MLDFVEIIILKSSPTLHSLLQFFRCLSNDIALRGLFLHNCVVFSLFCVDSEFEPVFERAHFGTDFAAISLRLDIFGLKQTEAKEIILK